MGKRICVERAIRAPIETVWRYTQSPDLHERWDARFTDIDYLPRPDESQPQLFLYAARIGFGVRIEGRGESVAQLQDGETPQTSALKFWSDDPKSLIRVGTGYWKYVAVKEGVRFITGYDYEVRFGLPGRVFDALLFRPWIGWATAWSFDRLRLWLEDNLDPAVALRLWAIHVIARVTVAFVWLYQGAVPKLIFRHPGELAMIERAGFSSDLSPMLLQVVGWGEIAFGLVFLVFWRARWPSVFTIGLMAAILVGVAVTAPADFTTPFNPATLNVLMIALAIIEWLSARNIPSARNCLRQPSRGEA